MSSGLASFSVGLMLIAWASTGTVALIAVMRSRNSRLLGMTSLACLLVGLSAAFVFKGKSPNSGQAFAFLFCSIPGILGIIYNRKPPMPPGHCTKCGYNLTGNVSGRCSECGTAIANSEERMAKSEERKNHRDPAHRCAMNGPPERTPL